LLCVKRFMSQRKPEPEVMLKSDFMLFVHLHSLVPAKIQTRSDQKRRHKQDIERRSLFVDIDTCLFPTNFLNIILMICLSCHPIKKFGNLKIEKNQCIEFVMGFVQKLRRRYFLTTLIIIKETELL
jgi:hypothetical protein